MKTNILFTAVLLIAMSFGVQAQRYAFIDTDYILEQIPAYKEAQAEIDAQADKWEKQIEARYGEIEKM